MRIAHSTVNIAPSFLNIGATISVVFLNLVIWGALLLFDAAPVAQAVSPSSRLAHNAEDNNTGGPSADAVALPATRVRLENSLVEPAIAISLDVVRVQELHTDTTEILASGEIIPVPQVNDPDSQGQKAIVVAMISDAGSAGNFSGGSASRIVAIKQLKKPEPLPAVNDTKTNADVEQTEFPDATYVPDSEYATVQIVEDSITIVEPENSVSPGTNLSVSHRDGADSVTKRAEDNNLIYPDQEIISQRISRVSADPDDVIQQNLSGSTDKGDSLEQPLLDTELTLGAKTTEAGVVDHPILYSLSPLNDNSNPQQPVPSQIETALIEPGILAKVELPGSISSLSNPMEEREGNDKETEVANVMSPESPVIKPKPVRAKLKFPSIDVELLQAIEAGDIARVTAFLDSSDRINVVTDRGDTPLMRAAWSGNLKLTEILLEAGAVTNYKSRRGNTALLYAVIRGHLDIASRLITAKARIDQSTIDGKTALMAAAWNNRPQLVSRLIENGAKVSKADNAKRTALYYAVSAGNSEIATLLIDAGADPRKADSSGLSIIQLANKKQLELPK